LYRSQRTWLASLVFCVWYVACLLTVPSAVLAQSLLDGGQIEAIRVEGSQRIEPATVRSYMRLNPGDIFDPERLDASLKNIFSTGLFADVALSREGNVLVVSVVENPIISQIAFEGNDRIDDETLGNEVQLRSRLVFTRTKVQQDVQRVLDIYRRSGRFAATVEPKVIQLPQNRVNLVFEIDEGPLTTIKAINIVGNNAFSDSDLEDELASSEYSFWNFLTTTDTYDPDRLAFDRDLLRRFYRNEGYADFTVLSVVAELTEDREEFIITFTVDEGVRYKFGTTEFIASLRDLEPESLRRFVAYSEDDWFNASLVEETSVRIIDALGNRGFAFVEVDPQVDKDEENRIVNLTFEVNEGPKVFVERIDIEGNFRTLDEVVRREFRLVEGDAFNVTKLRRSRSRIQNLGFFSAVDLQDEPGSQPDRAVVKVTVEEQSTGNLSFGIGISSAVGPIGNIGIQERNLLGRGQDLRANLRVAGSETQARIGFTEPYFLDRDVSAGFDFFRISQDRDESSFDLERIGGSVRFGYSLSENLRHVVRHTVEYQDIGGMSLGTSAVIRDEQGSEVRSISGSELSYDTLDNRFDPRSGMVVKLRNELGGLGGNSRFVKGELTGGYYIPVTRDWTLALRGGVGAMTGIADDTSIVDRFFLGGSDPRGFKFGGLGPRDAAGNDSLGGERYYKGSAEMSFPLGLPEDLAIRGRLFTDVASVWEVDDRGTGAKIEDSSAPRVTVGGGISWNSPFGPVIVDLGFAVVDESYDETEVLSFSFGTQF
jgi:outer membrane protein insertion porin family